MDLNGSVALVTGGNRGMGRHYVQQLLERGATKVYVGSRAGADLGLPGTVPVQLDITDPASVAAAAAVAQDVTVLINNAGISTGANLLGDTPVDDIRAELETNFFGHLNMVRAFAPILAANGGGAILNMLSAMSWWAFDGGNAYGVAKAAAWSFTNGIRLELAGQGTHVVGLHVGLVDTDMAAGFDMPKADPADIVQQGLDAIASGALEVIADDTTRDLKAALSQDPSVLYPQVATA